VRTMLRSTLTVLVVATALGTVAATAATAATLPELVNSKGEALVHKKFTFTGPSSIYIFLETKKNGELSCTGSTAKGEVEGTTGGQVTFTYTGCSAFSSLKCTTAGKREGEITFATSVKPVWIHKATEDVALLISVLPVTKGGFQFNCGGLWPITVSGSFLVRVLPVNELKTTYIFEAKQKHGVQEPPEYENGAGEKVEATLDSESTGLHTWAKEGSATEAEWKAVFEEEVEFKA
jgi:hypothetical protein